MEFEKQLIREQIEILANENYQVPLCEGGGKDAELSVQVRLEGNQLYSQQKHTAKEHQALLNLYSRSVALAPVGSEDLALAFSNRSAVLCHINRFSDCIKDVDRALGITESDHLRVKLYCRKVHCLTAIGLPGRKDNYYKALGFFGKIDYEDEKKESLADFIAVAQKMLETDKFYYKEYDNSESKEILLKREKKDVFNFVEMKYSDDQGRHLVAAKNFRPGEIIFIEKPYAVFPNDAKLSYLYCAHCLKLSVAGIPCDFCSWCLFCSEECKEEAWKKYHEVECPIVSHIKEPESSSMCLKLALRIFILLIKEAGSIDKLRAELKNIDGDGDKYKRCYSTSKLDNLIKVVYTLSSNISDELLNNILSDLTKNLLSIVQFPPFFGPDIADMKLENLAKNENFLFIGALLLKLTKITASNKFSAENYFFKFSTPTPQDEMKYGDVRVKGISLQLIGSFFNNCCYGFANAEKFYTEDSRLVLYAIEPIKKNSQIFIEYLGTYDLKGAHSKLRLKLEYGMDCQCCACKVNYSFEAAYGGPTLFSTIDQKYTDWRLEVENMDKIDQIRKTRDEIRNKIEDVVKVLKKPNAQLMIIKSIMSTTYKREYGLSERVFVKC